MVSESLKKVRKEHKLTQQDIADVAADDIADGNAGGAFQRAGDADSGLRQTGAHGHDGEAYYQLRNAEFLCQCSGTVYEPVSALHKNGKADGKISKLN